MTTPKDERTWASFKAEFLEPGSDCTWKQYPEPSAIMDFLHTHQAALAEEMEAEKYPNVFNDYREGYNQALDDALAIIRRHLTPDNPPTT